MKVTSVDSNSNMNETTFKSDNIISELEKVKAELQEQIQKTYESKVDDKVKKDRIDGLKDQIQQIDMQIQQIQADRLNKNQKKDEKGSKDNLSSEKNKDRLELSTVNDLVKVNSTYSMVKLINKTKSGFEGKSRILKMEIKLDGARGRSDDVKRDELRQVVSKNRILEKKLGEKLHKTQNEISEASEKAAKYSSEEYWKKENEQIEDYKKIDMIV